ncbi:MarR family winged helix-turn-helix transcriptional regulator [Nocardia callitridis]|uniref:HTH marR-type domain-containing protein n=1 Tax=Nocardia callitridis TaxID=648753 RepID=A0ABP9K7Q8_9NOCA
MNSLDGDLPELFLRVAKQIRRNQATRLAPLGLTPGQARALRVVGRDGELRMTALAARLDIVPRSATTVVDALESAGLVSRDTDPDNRRATLVRPTEAGRAALTSMTDARRAAAAELFTALSPAQRETLRELLATLLLPDPDSAPDAPAPTERAEN